MREDHVGYIADWLEVLKNDKRCVVQAASYAQKAVDYLHGLQPQPVAAAAAYAVSAAAYSSGEFPIRELATQTKTHVQLPSNNGAKGI